MDFKEELQNISDETKERKVSKEVIKNVKKLKDEIRAFAKRTGLKENYFKLDIERQRNRSFEDEIIRKICDEIEKLGLKCEHYTVKDDDRVLGSDDYVNVKWS